MESLSSALVGDLTTRVRDAFQKGNNSGCDLILALSHGDGRREGFKETDVGGVGETPITESCTRSLGNTCDCEGGTEELKTWTGYLPK